MSGRIRTIKPEWLEDEHLAEAGTLARLLSVALIVLADDHGRGRANEVVIAAKVFTYEPDPIGCVREAFARLSRIDFIQLYTVRGQRYYWIRNWSKHQRVDRPSKPRFPSPEEDDSGTDGGPPMPPGGGLPGGPIARPSRDPRETLAPDLDLDPDQGPATTDARARATRAPASALAAAPAQAAAGAPPPPALTAAAAAQVIDLDARRSPPPPSDIGEAHKHLERSLRTAWEGPMQRGAWMTSEFQSLRESAVTIWEAVGADGARFVELVAALVERWKRDPWVRKQHPVRKPVGTFRNGLQGYFEALRAPQPEPEEPFQHFETLNEFDARVEALIAAEIERESKRLGRGLEEPEWRAIRTRILDEEGAAYDARIIAASRGSSGGAA